MGKVNVTAPLFDLSAAFDTIDHKLLLDRLEEWFGNLGDTLQWVGSYLSDRCQLISIQDRRFIYGVPQGCVLGAPTFYTIYKTI